MMNKKATSFVLTMAMGMAVVMPVSAAGIEAYVNNSPITFDTAPVIVEGSTLVPARAIFEALGGKMEWNEATQTVSITTKDGKVIGLVIGKTEAKVDQIDVSMAVPAQIMDGRTMVPLRFVSENCGYKVDWNNETQRIDIAAPGLSTDKPATTPTTPLTPVAPPTTTAKDTTFSSTSGVKIVVADNTWKQAKASDVYTDVAENEDDVDLTLIKGDDKAFFTIDQYACSEDVATLKEIFEMSQKLAKSDGKDNAIEALKSVDFTTEAIAPLQAAWDKETVDYNDLYIQVTNADWFADLKADYKDFVMVGQENITVLGKTATLFEYKFTNESGVLLHNYEAVLIDNNKCYTFSGWTGESDFNACKAELKNMMTKATK